MEMGTGIEKRDDFTEAVAKLEKEIITLRDRVEQLTAEVQRKNSVVFETVKKLLDCPSPIKLDRTSRY